MLSILGQLRCGKRKPIFDPSSLEGLVLVNADCRSTKSLYDTVNFCGGPSPQGECGRFAAVKGLGMLDTPAEAPFDRITKAMSELFRTPVSLITLVAEPERVWFKSCLGPFGSCVDRDGSWCNYVLVPPTPEVLITEDASVDARFSHNPYVAGDPLIKFYAGAPLVGSNGERYGTLCVVDLVPRAFTAEVYSILTNFAALATEEIERNKTLKRSVEASQMNDVERNRHLDMSLMASRQGMVMVDVREAGWAIRYMNPTFEQTLGSNSESGSEASKCFWDLFEEEMSGQRAEAAKMMGSGGTFEFTARAKSNWKTFDFCLMPATSDRLAPSKSSGIPAWVPSEDAPAGTKLGLDVGQANIIGVECRDKEKVSDTKCFWLLVILQSTTASSEGPGSSLSSEPYHTYTSTPGQGQNNGVSSVSESSGPFSRQTSRSSSRYSEYVAPTDLGDVFGVQLGPLLGSGAYGRVYRCTTVANEAVAMKVIDRRGRGKGALSDQLAEIQLSMSFDHPSVVKVLAHGVSTEQKQNKSIRVLWILQELCDLGTLMGGVEAGWLRLERKIDAGPNLVSVIHTLHDIASGMAYLHSKSIIHFDLTGRNVLLKKDGSKPRGWVAKVNDFGKSRFSGDAGAPLDVGEDLGTVTHMPPEVLSDSVLVPAADVWAFGTIAWEAYHGKMAYGGRSVPQIILTIVSGQALSWEPPPPENLAALLKRCMSVDREKRPTFTEIVQELQTMM